MGSELPFLYVELAAFKKPQSEPVEPPPSWAFIREAQAEVLKLPRTGVATAADAGMEKDIHPIQKKIVGMRLAGLAATEVYKQEGLSKSPQYAGSDPEGGKIRIRLEDAKGLRSRTPEVKGFAIRSEDGEWVWAEAKIDGEAVLVWSEQVQQPSAVRYGWANNPVLSLENEAGLPLRPFRTDPSSPQ